MTTAKKILGLLGRGIGYSYSPLIHNTALEILRLPYYYTIFDVADHDRIGVALKGAAALGIAGFNITIPYKQTVVPFLDDLSGEASSIQAVNTIVIREGRLLGHNTDIEGFASPLLQYGETISGSKAAIFGMGGAALAAIEAFRRYFSIQEILLFVRDAEKALSMLQSSPSKDLVTIVPLDRLLSGDETAVGTLDSCTALVNATPVGTKGRADASLSIVPAGAGLIRKGQIVYDMVYNPFETPLLAAAKKVGAETVPGIEMLIGQAALSFELWTGNAMPLDKVRPIVLKALQETI
ncbi:MAG: shikimate dehydrogenase [Chlorobiaceae bacterium]|nr:shikimate dehydrogenase [Chlorobiaceae bacterium]